MTAPDDAIMSIAEAHDRFVEITRRAARDKERTLITDGEKPVALIVPIEDLELLEEIEEARDLAEFRAAKAEAAREGTIPWEEIKSKYGY